MAQPPLLQVTGYEVRLVAPLPAPPPLLPIERLDLGGAADSTVHTTRSHNFSGAKQLATLAGLGDALNGIYAVTAAQPGSSSLKVKLPKLKDAAAAEVQQAVAGGAATVRWAAGFPLHPCCVDRGWQLRLPALPTTVGLLPQLLPDPEAPGSGSSKAAARQRTAGHTCSLSRPALAVPTPSLLLARPIATHSGRSMALTNHSHCAT